VHVPDTSNAVKFELFHQYLASSRRQKKVCGLVKLFIAPIQIRVSLRRLSCILRMS